MVEAIHVVRGSCSWWLTQVRKGLPDVLGWGGAPSLGVYTLIDRGVLGWHAESVHASLAPPSQPICRPPASVCGSCSASLCAIQHHVYGVNWPVPHSVLLQPTRSKEPPSALVTSYTTHQAA